jgi:recombination protein RecT
MANSLSNVNTQAVVGNFTQKELDTLKQTIAKGTTNEQFALFVQTCVNSGLNPFLNHIHCIVYDGKQGPTMSLQIAVEGIQYLARKTEGYGGIDCQLVHENDEVKVARGDDGNITVKEHEFGFPRGKVIGGYAIAKREGFPDVVVVIEVDEIQHLTKGRNGHMWRDWFNDMLKKHIIKRAAKLQFGIEIAEDEQVQAGTTDIPEYNKPRKDITPNQEVIVQQQGEGPKEETQPEDNVTALRKEMTKKFKELGYTTKASINKYIEDNNVTLSNPPTESELIGLIELLDMNLDMKEAEEASDDELPE